MIWRKTGRNTSTLICAAIWLVATITILTTTAEPAAATDPAEATESAGVAEAAYELRMNGRLEEAEKMLVEALAQDPDDAAGHYELARLKLHRALGDPQELANLLPEAQRSIDQAMAKDPDSVVFPYFAGLVGFMRAYLAMQMGDAEAAERAASSCQAFETALRLKPDYREAMLHLVELYGEWPDEMGGDRTKAESYQTALAEMDEIYGLKARSVLDDIGVADWQALLEKRPGNLEILEELGKAHLAKDDVTAASKWFEEAVKIDPREVTLFLDLGRYHVFGAIQAMQNDDQERLQSHLTAAAAAIGRYLEAEHPAPMQAYAMELLAKVKLRQGEQDEGNRLREEARALDPFHSKATGGPSPALFTPPGTILHCHRYLARPY